MAKPMLKHAVAWLLALMVAFVVAPSMALADDLVAADEGGESTPVLTVYKQYANEDPVQVKSFTQAELEEIAAQNTEPLAYIYSGFVSKADKYIKLDQLLKAANKKLTVTDEDEVAVVASDGLEAKFTNKLLKAPTKFFAGISYDGDKFDYSDLGDAKDAPAILALSEGKAKWKDHAGSTAGALLEDIETSSDSAPQWLCGVTEESVTGDSATLSGGKSAPSHVVSITVKTPASNAFTVYCQDGEASEPTAVKEYTRETLETLAASGSKGYLYWATDVWMAGITTSSVDIVKLIEDAGLKLEANDTLVIAAPDGFKATLSAASIQSEKYFYPAATETGTDASDPDEVGAVLALNWAVVPVTGTAGGTVADYSSALTNQYRLFTGVSEENYLAKKAAGNRFVTNPRALTLIKGEADFSSAKVTLDKAQAAYTGASQQGTVKSVVLDGVELPASAYEVAAESGVNAGTYKVTVAGKGHYVGSATAEFKITPAIQTVVAKNKKAGTLKAKKLKKKAQTIKAAKVTKGDSAKTKLTYKLVKANKSKSKFKVAANGKITVKKKLKKGTYKLTIKASAEKSANYQAASKNFVVTIKVK